MPEQNEGEMASKDVMSFLSESMNLTQPEGEESGDQGEGETGSQEPDTGAEGTHSGESHEGDTGEGDQGDTAPAEGDQENAGEGEVEEGEGGDRYKYWQSQYDKLKSQYDQEMNQYKQRLQQIEQQIGQGQQQQQQNQEPTVDEQIQQKHTKLQELDSGTPKPPSKPSDYNEQDAYTDPDSPSFRYQRELDQYNAKVTEYLQERDKVKDELYDLRIKKVEEPTRQLQQKEQMSQQHKVVVDTVRSKYNLSEEQAHDFVKTMSSPDSLSMDNLVNFYKFQKGLATPSSSKPPKPSGKPNRQPQKTVAAPPPAKGGSGGSGTDSPDENDFTGSLLAGSDLI